MSFESKFLEKLRRKNTRTVTKEASADLLKQIILGNLIAMRMVNEYKDITKIEIPGLEGTVKIKIHIRKEAS